MIEWRVRSELDANSGGIVIIPSKTKRGHIVSQCMPIVAGDARSNFPIKNTARIRHRRPSDFVGISLNRAKSDI